MIVLRNKQFTWGTFGAVNVARAAGFGKGAAMTTKQRLNQAAMGAGKLGLTGAAVYGTAKGLGATKDALKGEMGEENASY